MKHQLRTASQAADLIFDGATLAANGFMMTATAYEIYHAIEQLFLDTHSPKDLSLLSVTSAVSYTHLNSKNVLPPPV